MASPGRHPGSFPDTARLFLRGLQSAPALNGAEVALRSAGGPGRWGVAPLQPPGAAPISVKGERLRLLGADAPLTTRDVRVHGALSQPDWEGRTAHCGPFLADTCRWSVSVRNEASGLTEAEAELPGDCLVDSTSGTPLGEPVGVGDRCFGDRLQKCLLARWAFEPGDVLFHERCAVVVMDVGAVPLTAGMAHLYHQLGIAVQQFLKLPQAVKHQLLDLHATDTFQVAMGATSQQLVADACVDKVALSRAAVMGGVEAAGQPIPAAEAEAVWRFLRVWQCNAVAVAGGAALAVTLSRANHSCRPNVFRAELSPHVVALVALTRIQPGEEICLSYLSDMKLLQPKELRQAALRTWCHPCECSRCDGGEEEELQDVRCFTRPGCPGQHQWAASGWRPCRVCGAEVTAEDRRRLVQQEHEFSKLYTTIDSDPGAVSQAECQVMVRAMTVCEAAYPIGHWLCIRFHSLVGDFCAQMGELAEACRHATAIVQALDRHFPRPSVRRALQRGAVARLLRLRGQRYEAAVQLLQALKEASLLLPPGHEHCVDLREALEKTFRS